MTAASTLCALTIGALTILPVIADAQTPPAVTAPESRIRPVVMEKAKQWTACAKSGRLFEISLAFPSGAMPEHGYPVIYVLDPGTAFATLVDTVRNQEPLFGPVVVVGVGYASDADSENRTYDMTPPTDPKDLPTEPPGAWAVNGGNEAFLSFLIDELKPAISKTVQIDPGKQALFGHSLGGLFVLHALFSRSDAFDIYVAGSPSIWWGKKSILREIADFKSRQENSKIGKRLLITVGELESTGGAEELRLLNEMKFDASKMAQESRQVGNAADLARNLDPLSKYGLNSRYVVFQGETHNSVIPSYLARGVRFTLQAWFE